jgi:GT2 family glycosyltransferase
MLDLSIVIVNYNVKEFLSQCLDSIYQSKTNYGFEVIVVDNQSSDSGEAEILSQFPKVRWINNDENLGFGKANNVGFQAAQGTYTLILNPDTVLRSDTLEKSIDYLKSHPEVGGLGIQGIDGSGNSCPNPSAPFLPH